METEFIYILFILKVCLEASCGMKEVNDTGKRRGSSRSRSRWEGPESQTQDLVVENDEVGMSRKIHRRSGKEVIEPSPDDFYHLYKVESEVKGDFKVILKNKRAQS